MMSAENRFTLSGIIPCSGSLFHGGGNHLSLCFGANPDGNRFTLFPELL
ncbi:MAG: hypothetical protein J0H31_12425 [Alphaproteobacteria bacterium]|nr:hypothetical protein [Alphaproteobacteria bacterium]